MGWRQIGTVALLVTAASAAAAAERNGRPLAFETLGDAHDRQRAEDYRARQDSRALIRNERVAPLGDPRVHRVPPARGYTTHPPGGAPGLHNLQ